MVVLVMNAASSADPSPFFCQQQIMVFTYPVIYPIANFSHNHRCQAINPQDTGRLPSEFTLISTLRLTFVFPLNVSQKRNWMNSGQNLSRTLLSQWVSEWVRKTLREDIQWRTCYILDFASAPFKLWKSHISHSLGSSPVWAETLYEKWNVPDVYMHILRI